MTEPTKRRRRTVVEAEIQEQAAKLVGSAGSGKPPGAARVSTMEALIGEHRRTPFKYYDGIGEELVTYFADAIAWWTNYNDSGTGKVLPKSTYPTMERFARTKGCSKFAFYDWCEKHPEFALCYAEALEMQKAFIMEGAMSGAIPAQFAMFMLKCNHGMTEPQAGDNDGDSDDVVMRVHGEGQKV